MFREAGDVDDLGQEAGGDDRAQAFDGNERVGDGIDAAGDLLIEASHEASDGADVFPGRGQGGCDHQVGLVVHGIGCGESTLYGAGSGVRVVEAAVAAVSDEVSQLVVGHLAQFGGREFGQEGSTGGSKDVGESLDTLPIAAFEEGIGLKADFLLGEIAGELEAVAGETAQALPEVIWDVGDWPMADLYPSGDVERVPSIVLGPSQDQGIFEIGDELGVEAHLLQVEGLEGFTGLEEAVQGDPQHTGGFVADLDAGIAQVSGDVGQARGSGLGARQVVGNIEGCDNLVAGAFVHGPQGDLLQVDIRTDT